MTAQHAPGGPGPRREIGDQESSQKRPPHVDENVRGAPVQGSSQSPGEVPALPANASGSDHAEGGEQPHGIDHGSMYERRPEEDKDR